MDAQLKVGDARQRDVGRGIGRIENKIMQQLNVSAGDAITLSGSKKTSVLAWPAYSDDENRDLIRIDGFTRKNAGVSIGEQVSVCKGSHKMAAGAILAPIDMRLNVDDDFTNFVRNRLQGRVITQGDVILVMMLGHAIPFNVVRVSPNPNVCDSVEVSDDTSMNILNEPFASVQGGNRPKPDLKMLFRHDWLKLVSSRTNANRVAFAIAGQANESENESEIIDRARTMANENLRAVDVVVKFYSGKGDIIGTMPWIAFDAVGESQAVYPDIQIPPDPGYFIHRTENMEMTSSIMRRCFKIGLKKCPKEINFSPKMVFVAMPFRPDFQDLYKYAIRPALEELGLKIWKADEKISNIDVMCKICHGIQECSHVIANISDWNPNVLFEMGLAYGTGKNVVLIKNRKEEVPVDLRGLEYIDYEDIDELKRNLIAFFKGVREI